MNNNAYFILLMAWFIQFLAWMMCMCSCTPIEERATIVDVTQQGQEWVLPDTSEILEIIGHTRECIHSVRRGNSWQYDQIRYRYIYLDGATNTLELYEHCSGWDIAADTCSEIPFTLGHNVEIDFDKATMIDPQGGFIKEYEVVQR